MFKYVFIVVLYILNWDFLVGLLVCFVLGFDIRYVGKVSLFCLLLGWFFCWLGGYFVDCSCSIGYVDVVVDVFNEKEAFVMCIVLEGI